MKEEEEITVHIKQEDLNLKDDYFFLTNDLLAVPLKQEFCYAIIRTKDGSSLCSFDSKCFRFVFNTTSHFEVRAIDVAPKYIVDKFTGEVFDVNLKTLIHLGATNLRLYPNDLCKENPQKNGLYLLGRPSIPAIFAKSFYIFN